MLIRGPILAVDWWAVCICYSEDGHRRWVIVSTTLSIIADETSKQLCVDEIRTKGCCYSWEVDKNNSDCTEEG